MAKNTNTNSKKNTKSVEDTVLYATTANKNTKKKTTKPTTFVGSNTKSTKSTTTATDTTKKVTASAVTTSLNDNKKTGSGGNQIGKKRGSYSKNLWLVLSSQDGKKWDVEQEFFESRDEAREAMVVRFRGQYPNEKFRLAKYVFSSVDKA